MFLVQNIEIPEIIMPTQFSWRVGLLCKIKNKSKRNRKEKKDDIESVHIEK